eukprot:9570367-Lingulodinium_polyedra.AAC.1
MTRRTSAPRSSPRTASATLRSTQARVSAAGGGWVAGCARGGCAHGSRVCLPRPCPGGGEVSRGCAPAAARSAGCPRT